MFVITQGYLGPLVITQGYASGSGPTEVGDHVFHTAAGLAFVLGQRATGLAHVIGQRASGLSFVIGQGVTGSVESE